VWKLRERDKRTRGQSPNCLLGARHHPEFGAIQPAMLEGIGFADSKQLALLAVRNNDETIIKKEPSPFSREGLSWLKTFSVSYCFPDCPQYC